MEKAKTISLPNYRKAGELAQLIRARIAAGQCHTLSIEKLSRDSTLCDTVLMRAFKQRHGITIHAFIIREKMELAKKRILSSNTTIRTIASELGYSELSNFSRDFARTTGISPQVWRRRHAGPGLHENTALLS